MSAPLSPTMAFLFAYDRKPLREEEAAVSRINSRVPSRQSSIRGNPAESPLPTPDAKTEYTGADKGAPPFPYTPSPGRRNIVVPDHVAFR